MLKLKYKTLIATAVSHGSIPAMSNPQGPIFRHSEISPNYYYLRVKLKIPFIPFPSIVDLHPAPQMHADDNS